MKNKKIHMELEYYFYAELIINVSCAEGCLHVPKEV